MKDSIYKLIKEAESLRDRSEYIDSLRLYRRALSISKRYSIIDGVLDSTIAIADIYRMVGNFDGAVKKYEEAIEACEALGNRLTAADCMVGMGLSLRAVGFWKEAIRFISSARKIYMKENDRKGIAFSLWAEAGALRVSGAVKRAIKKFNESKDIFSYEKDESGVAYALCGLGGTHRIAGKFKESMDYYKQANEKFKVLKDKFGIAYSHCGIGNAFRMAGVYREALKHFEKASVLYEEIGDIVSYSYTIWSFANVYKMKGDISRARLYITKALKNFKKTRDPRGIIYCNLTIGELNFMKGRKNLAEEKFISALMSAERHDFKLEKCHSNMLLMSIKGKIPNVPSCYKKIGIDLDFTGIPFNMP